MNSFFANLEGAWEGRATTWFGPGEGFSDPWSMEFQLLQGGKFVLQRHSLEVQGKPHQGWALIGRDDSNEYSMSLADSFHTAGTGLLMSRGRVDESGQLSVLGHFEAGGEQWGWRTTLQVQGEALTLRAYNISPAGEESLAIEAPLTRTHAR